MPILICGLCYKHVTLVNDDSSIISKWSFKLIDAPRVIIYDRHRFIVLPTGLLKGVSQELDQGGKVCLWPVLSTYYNRKCSRGWILTLSLAIGSHQIYHCAKNFNFPLSHHRAVQWHLLRAHFAYWRSVKEAAKLTMPHLLTGVTGVKVCAAFASEDIRRHWLVVTCIIYR